MHQRPLYLLLLLALPLAAEQPVRLSIYPGEVQLTGRSPQQQLAVTAHYASGRKRDVTHEVTFSSSTDGVIRSTGQHAIVAVADGTTELTATLGQLHVKLKVVAKSINKF